MGLARSKHTDFQEGEERNKERATEMAGERGERKKYSAGLLRKRKQ